MNILALTKKNSGLGIWFLCSYPTRANAFPRLCFACQDKGLHVILWLRRGWGGTLFRERGGNQKNKLRTFRKFKTIENYKCEDYLCQVTNIRHRITLTKLRLSDHKLAIETGRYVRPYKKPEERICPICKKDVEDEIHFLTL